MLMLDLDSLAHKAARLLVQRCSPENSKPSGVVRTFDLTTGGCNE
jgi:hypothetical protein